LSDQEKSPGEWVAWQSWGPKGAGRRSRRHFTRDGKHAVCGRPIPEKGQVLRFDPGVGDGVCPRCQRTAAPQEGKEPKSDVRPVARLVDPPCAVYAIALLFERGRQRRLVSILLPFKSDGPSATDDVLAWARTEALSNWPQELGAPMYWRITEQSISQYVWLGDKVKLSPPERTTDMVFNPSLGRMVTKDDRSYPDIPSKGGQTKKMAPDVQGVADLD
jgi:hypothetical protein